MKRPRTIDPDSPQAADARRAIQEYRHAVQHLVHCFLRDVYPDRIDDADTYTTSTGSARVGSMIFTPTQIISIYKRYGITPRL